ncbi:MULTISPECIES: ferredoxin [Gordonia]|jgi:ferredoxin|uniref:Ferredoxin n=1 Tax=Gordonia amicalis TaxID=89053 RepID=A0AAE4R3L1_9ACTN|nr:MULTISPECIES: ferredoxin [Gordonia]KAF0968062.1 Ferredoxin [Gordonia sp. YY1]MBA5845726.1 ferredoxin [Gordonia amicalis]MCZ0914835.1 ferredoxin [Gordonia amicalis]MCZ4578628.1 ferredoxin [Gordonia amicalis]MDV6311467.1 ferredoxin [Gordonia amicalis]
MRVVVDQDRCGGHGRCIAVAPDLFDLDDDGVSFPITEEIGTDQEAAAKEAIANCPQSAIRIE